MIRSLSLFSAPEATVGPTPSGSASGYQSDAPMFSLETQQQGVNNHVPTVLLQPGGTSQRLLGR